MGSGDVGVEVVNYAQQYLCATIAGLGESLNTRAAPTDKRKFRSNKESISENKEKNDKDV